MLFGFPRVATAAPAPDLNNDGIPERIVTPSLYSRAHPSSVAIVDGVSGAAIRRLSIGDPDEAFGWSACWVGDADTDGLPDVAVSAPMAPSGAGFGRVYVFSSATGAVIFDLAPIQSGQFGLRIHSAGDLTGDGIDDIGVWSHLIDPAGAPLDVYWVFSGRTGEQVRPTVGIAELGEIKRADVDGSLLVDAEDVVEVASALGNEPSGAAQAMDVDRDGSIVVQDVLTVIGNIGAVIDAPPQPLAFVGWSTPEAVSDQLRESYIYRICPGYPLCSGTGGGNGSGAGGSGTIIIPSGHADDPGDPDNTRDPCSPSITRSSKYICLRPEQDCTEIALSAAGGTGTAWYMWEVTGGVFVLQDGNWTATTIGKTVTLLVCNPGIVTVTLSRAGSGCPTPNRRVFRAFRADIDIDSDNSGHLDDPLLSAHEEEVEQMGPDPQHPGKVIQVGNWDADLDGIENRLDGFDLLGAPITIDDSSPHVVPRLAISIRGPIEANTTVSITYAGANPLAPPTDPSNPFVPPPKPLRLWTVPTSSPRDPRPLLQGGNYLAPGEYRFQELEDRLGPGLWWLWVEGTHPELTAVSVAVDPDGPAFPTRSDIRPGGYAPYMCADAVQITCSQLTLEGRGIQSGTQCVPEADADQWYGFVGSALRADPLDLGDPGVDPYQSLPVGSFMLHRLVIDDWRSFQSTGVTIGGQTLGIFPIGTGKQATPWFLVTDAAPAAQSNPGYPVVILPGGPSTISYNPEQPTTVLASAARRGYVKSLQRLVDAVVDAFDELPAGTNPNHDGAYGDLIHREVSQRLPSSGGRWKASVWVDLDTRQVLSVGSLDFTTNNARHVELDIAYLKYGRTIRAEQVFNPEDIEDVFEIKTSHTGKISPLQLRKYHEAMGRPPQQVWTAKRLRVIDGVQHIGVNNRALNRMDMAKKVGVVGAVVVGTGCIISIVSGEEQERFDELVVAMRDYRSSGNDPHATILNGVVLMDKMRAWLDSWCPLDLAKNLINAVLTRKIIDDLWRDVAEGE